MADVARKIAIIVTAQIILIIASFLLIVHFESQTHLAGNIVNVAGKSRVLTILVHTEMTDEILDRGQIHDGSGTMVALDNLRDNILFLKEGGTMSGIEIFPISQRFDAHWNEMWSKFNQYEASVLEFISTGSGQSGNSTGIQTGMDIGSVKQIGDELVILSDTLTDRLGQDVDILSSNLILLQLSLGTVNVAAHLFMIYLIWKIFHRYAEQRIRMEKFAMAGEFAAMIAHNMKNPLGTILNSAMLIRSNKNAVDSATAKIERSVKRMSQQIDGVTSYVRDVPFVAATGSMQELLRRSLDSITLPDRIDVNLPKSDVCIMCDHEKMEIVFANLLLNAMQAVGDDSGHITVRLAEETGGSKEQDASVTIEFENSGPPIPADDMPMIFEPLFTTKMQGTGLGLAICRSIINQHNGSITVANDPVRFILRLPQKCADYPE